MIKRWWNNTKDLVEDKIVDPIKFYYQSFEYKCDQINKGYSNEDVFDLDIFIVEKIRNPFKAYVRYQEEHGKTLPKDFKTNPSGWLEVLSKIEYAFDAYQEDFESGFFIDIEKTEKQKIREQKIQEGFELFGKYLKDLYN